MRAREFVREDRNDQRADGQLISTYDQANPGALTGHDIDRFYDTYRAGMLMAAGPDNIKHLDASSWINNQPYFGAYTEVDRQKILSAFKALGIRPKTLIEPGSLEHKDVHTQSPVKSFRGYPR
jgi:hypothetical protein